MTETNQPTKHWHQYLWTSDGRWREERDVRALFDEDNLELLENQMADIRRKKARRKKARRRLGFTLKPYLAGPWSWLMRGLFG